MISRINSVALPAALGLLLFLGASVQAKPLSGAALSRLNGHYTAIWKGRKARVQLMRNGTLRAVSEGKYDVGRWKVRGNALCVSFKVWTGNKYKCGTVEKKGAWYVGLYRSNGKPRLKFRRP